MKLNGSSLYLSEEEAYLKVFYGEDTRDTTVLNDSRK
jgi:hypothetical protein